MTDPRATYTAVNVRALSIIVGDKVKIGGLCFTRLSPDHALSRHSTRQKARYVEIKGVRHCDDGLDRWVELMFIGGDSPSSEREMYALFRPFELVALQVVKEG